MGHPVKLTIIDDKGDPATGLAAAQKLVQQDHVIAIVGQAAGQRRHLGALRQGEGPRHRRHHD